MATTLRPKDAATLVLIKNSGAVPEVLLGQRHGGHAFMPNRYVFPGGRVDPSDSRVVPATSLTQDVARRLEKNCSPARARAASRPAEDDDGPGDPVYDISSLQGHRSRGRHH